MHASELEEKLKEVEKKIEEVKGRLPAHSVKPSIMMELLKLEDERDEVIARLNKSKKRSEDFR